MFVEDMDFGSYPSRSFKDSEGNPFESEGKPISRPASSTWRVDYVDKSGISRWEFWKTEQAGALAELPPEAVRIIEKRMKNPNKINRVSMGLFFFQEEPGGEWKPFKPNDKDPRAEMFYEGDYTRLYMEEWRKRAYESEFDPYKLTRSFNKEEAQRQELEQLRRQNKIIQDQLASERQGAIAAKLKAEEILRLEKAKVPTNKV